MIAFGMFATDSLPCDIADKQERALLAMAEYHDRYATAISYKELMVVLGVHSTSHVAYLIDRLVARGLVVRKRMQNRGLKVTRAGREYLTRRFGIAPLPPYDGDEFPIDTARWIPVDGHQCERCSRPATAIGVKVVDNTVRIVWTCVRHHPVNQEEPPL